MSRQTASSSLTQSTDWVEQFLSHFSNVRRSGLGYVARCPAHDDHHPSLSIRFVTVEDEQRVLIKCHRGCEVYDIVAAVGLAEKDLFEPREQIHVSVGSHEVVATYEYHDADGTLLSLKRRYSNKGFSWHRPNGTAGVQGIKKVVYRLDKIQGKDTIYIAEGEKDCDALADIGWPSTTNPDGAADAGKAPKWKFEYTDQVLNAGAKQIVVFADHDATGLAHAHVVAQALLAKGCKVKLVEFPMLPPKGDVSDYLSTRSKDDLKALVKATAEYTPPNAEARSPLFAFRRGGELDATPIEYLVEDMLPAGMLAALSGKDGRGKTLLALEIAKCVLTGTPFLGRFPVKQGKVFAVLLDDPESLIRERLSAMGILEHPNLRITTEKDVDLSNPKALLEAIGTILAAEHPTLILIDALYLFIPSGGGNDQGNSSGAMGPVMVAMNKVASQTGATTLLICHDNKAGGDIAGSYAIRAGLKAILRLLLPTEAEKDQDGGATPERVLQLNKLKTGRPASWRLRLDGPGRWVFQGGAGEFRVESLQTQIMEYLADEGFQTVEEIARGMKKKTEEVRRVCRMLYESKNIPREFKPRVDGRPGKGATIYGPSERAAGSAAATEKPPF